MLIAAPYLFLTQDNDPPCFDGVPGCQVVPGSPLHTVLVSLPLAVPCGPGDADVVPRSITHLQWQLGHLLVKIRTYLEP